MPIDQEVPGLIPGFALRFFSSADLFYDMYGLDVTVFQGSFFFYPVFSPDYRKGNALQLCPCSYVWSIENKAKSKEKKKKKTKNKKRHKFPEISMSGIKGS